LEAFKQQIFQVRYFLVPVVSLFTLFPFWLFTWKAEPFSKKTIKKGWAFSAQQK